MADKKLHVKPTKEELAANALKLAEEAEKLPEEDEEETPVEPPKEEPKEEKPVEEVKVEEKPAEKPLVEEKKEEKPEIDYKQKYRESTRESQVLSSKNRKYNEAVDEAAGLPEPTDEEMSLASPDWDVLSDFEKRIAKDTELNKRRFDLIHKASLVGKDIAAWNDKVDGYVDDPKTLIANPELEGKQEEFKIFASKQTRRGAPLEDLVKAFLFDVEKTAKPVNKGSMFPSGSAGPATPDDGKPKKISASEAINIRKNNYDEFKRLLKAGQIETEVV